jgi:hypothetical protein
VEDEKVDDPTECQDGYPYYPVGSYVVAVYQGAWYIGQVLHKINETQALPQDEYLFLNFMQRLDKNGGDLFKWRDKQDKLNTLKEDILFACGAPTPSQATSSSRSITFSLSKAETKKANMLLYKAYYHTKFIFYILFLPSSYFCLCAWMHQWSGGCQYGTSTGTYHGRSRYWYRMQVFGCSDLIIWCDNNVPLQAK